MIASEGWSVGFWDHVSDLRRTLLRCLAVAGIGLCVSFTFYDSVLSLLSYPLNSVKPSGLTHHLIDHERFENRQEDSIVYVPEKNVRVISHHLVEEGANGSYLILPGGSVMVERALPEKSLVILGPVEGFSIALKVCFWFSVAWTSPLWLYFVLQFLAPALNQKESRLLVPFLLTSLVFASVGLLFAYFVTIPLANQYLYAFNGEIGINLWSLAQYLDFTVVLLLANAVAFEMGVILLFLVHYQVITAKGLSEWRRVSIVAIFIISALLTPPDVLTQLLMAFPLMGLYEAMVLYAKWRERYIPVYLTGM